MRVFINYRTGDGEGTAAQVSHFLVKRLGESNVFLDGRSIQPGALYDHELLRHVWRSDALLAIMGPNWLTAKTGTGLDITSEDDWVRKELVEAFSHHVKVIPVLVGQAPWPRPEQLPDELAELNRCQYIRYNLFDTDTSLEQIATAVGAPSAPPPVAGPAPSTGAITGTVNGGGTANFGVNTGTVNFGALGPQT